MADPKPRRDGAVVPDELKALWSAIRELQRPTGTQRENTTAWMRRTIDYLGGLMTFAASGLAWNSGSIPRDATTRWYDGTAPVEITGLDVPTNRMTVEASVGEASMAPGGSYVIAFVSFRVYDANNVEVPQPKGVSSRAGRLYFDDRIGLTISSGPQPAVIPDRAQYPPPYRVRLQYGTWAAAENTADCSIQFNAPSLNVEIIGDGVPD